MNKIKKWAQGRNWYSIGVTIVIVVFYLYVAAIVVAFGLR